jgi:hypothetical protein
VYDAKRLSAAPLAGDDWCGLQGGFAVQAAGLRKPLNTYHYVPVLWLAATQPYAHAPAQPGPPATGLQAVQRKTGSPWAKAGSARTGADGSWRVKVRIPRTTDRRAVAQPAPGQPAEYSVIKRIVARRWPRVGAGPLIGRRHGNRPALRRDDSARLYPRTPPNACSCVRAPVTWFARRFVIELRGFAASRTSRRGRRARTSSLSLSRVEDIAR